LKILRFKELVSTQKYLVDLVESSNPIEEIAVIAKCQTDGIGTLGRGWKSYKGNLFFSFVLLNSSLPDDLPEQSVSIYFAHIFKEIISEFKANVWLKWPNDLYIGEQKVGGIVTSKNSNCLVCGIGLNTKNADEPFGKLCIDIDNDELVEIFLKKIKKTQKWKNIFSNYKIEFYHNLCRLKDIGLNDAILSRSKIVLNSDGSIDVDKKRICSSR
jgi:BirA family biotin operon repressor/biotin-[acetyl-CoA-carboxylase] ligase